MDAPTPAELAEWERLAKEHAAGCDPSGVYPVIAAAALPATIARVRELEAICRGKEDEIVRLCGELDTARRAVEILGERGGYIRGGGE